MTMTPSIHPSPRPPGSSFLHLIPIRFAMLAWSDASDGGRVRVIRWPDRGNLTQCLGLPNTAGACCSGWQRLKPSAAVERLAAEAWELSACHGIPADRLHAALRVIPEYRARFG